ncbi:PQQ-binding-like beta-propeller repeat protein [Streptomyces sp. NPDC050418]|uniref:outer membrane protein assembly factor BamB family protein n=1 Tax=Streptomyces sp. NPDC050418 TaxID=3365612 RepID=UPI00378DF1EF
MSHPRSPVSLVGAAAALALLAGAGIWFMAADGDDGPSGDGKQQTARFDGPGKEKVPADPEAGMLFHIADPKVGKSDFFKAPGSWVTDTTYVKSGVGKIAGYDLQSGRQVWEVPLAGQVCGFTEQVDEEGRTGILVEDGLPGKDGKFKPCTEIAVIDVDAGMLLWNKSLERSGTKIEFDQVAVGAGKVAVAGDEGGAAFDLADGRLRWEPRPTETCYDFAYGSGEDLVALQTCGQEDTSHARVQILGDGGKPRHTYNLPTGLGFAKVVSNDPLVVAGFSESMEITDFFAIDRRSGKLRSKIAVDPKQTMKACRIEAATECESIAVGNDRLYLATMQRMNVGESESANEIVSYDLATGKATGQKADSGDRGIILPLRMDGRNVLAYRPPLAGRNGQIVSIDGRTFKETLLLTVPRDAEAATVMGHFVGNQVELRYVDGRFFASEFYVRKPASRYEPPYLAAAFGGAP